MTIIESEKKQINIPQDVVYKFLTDLNNFEKLLPDGISNWQSDVDSCSFTLPNIPQIGLWVAKRTPISKIILKSKSGSPFSFDILTAIKPIDIQTTTVHFTMNADLNFMMKMIAVKPLTNFLNTLATKLELSGCVA